MLYRLILLLLLSIHLAFAYPALPWIQSWLRRRPDRMATYHRLCGSILAISILLFAAGVPLSFRVERVREGFLIYPLGILTTVGLWTMRRDLARQLAKRRRG